jgi:hypothetical protein
MSCINSVVDAVVVQTSWPRQRISGVAADGNGVAEVQINGVTAQMTTASPQDLLEAGLSGTGKICGLCRVATWHRPAGEYGHLYATDISDAG